MRKPHLVMALAAAVFLAASVGMALQTEPFFTWYYAFAWWPYILFLESWLQARDQHSPLYDRPGAFLATAALSVALWLLFEAVNFRLDNWAYLNLPAALTERWLGYAVNFATVLPAILVTKRFLELLGLAQDARCRPLTDARRLYGPLRALGLGMFFLPLALPLYFFPLIWGAFVLILEPWLHAEGEPSLLADLETGNPRAILTTLAAGLLCGLLWESWNFWAGAKWYYTVPFVGNVKLFEMPVLGFLGFPPFALECLVMTRAARAWWRRAPGRNRRIAVALAAAASLAAMYGVDLYSVTSFAA